MRHIQTISKALKFLFIVYAGLEILSPFFHWLVTPTPWFKTTSLYPLFEQGMMHMTYAGTNEALPIHTMNLSATAKSIGLLGALFITSLKLFGIVAFIQLMAGYESGKIFTPQQISHIKRIGWAFFLISIPGMIIADTLSNLATTIDLGPGQRILSISFGNHHVEGAVLGIIMVLLAYIMQEGLKLRTEQELTI